MSIKSVVMLSIVVVLGAATLAGAAPIIPYNQYGLASMNGTNLPESSVIVGWIDGVKYSNTTVNATGNYDIIIPGDDITSGLNNTIKEGGVDGDAIYFTYENAGIVYYANQTSVYVNGSSVELNLTFYESIQKALIYEVVAEPADGTDYVYLYFPDISSVNYQEWKLERCGNGTYAAWSQILSNLTVAQYPAGSNYLYVDLGGNVLSPNGGDLKLLRYSTSANAWFCVDRVEWNASVNGTHSYVPGNTIMPDASGATTPGMSIKRVGTPPQDTDNCSADFIVTQATERPPFVTEMHLPIMFFILLCATIFCVIKGRRKID